MANWNNIVEITVPFDYCSLSPCRNGGRCQNTGRSYFCHCPNNFSGQRCQNSDKTSNFNRVFTTKQPAVSTTANSLSAPGTAALGSLLALVVLTLIVVVCCLWRSKTRRVPLLTSGRPLNGSTNSMPRLSSFRSLSERVSFHLSRQQLHRHINTGVESRVGGGSVNNGYDPARDLPPPYVSVVAEPKLIIDVDNCQELPPSYDEVLAARSDVHATSVEGEVTTSQNGNTYSEGDLSSIQDRNTTSLEDDVTSVPDRNTTSLEGNVTSIQDTNTTSLEGDVMSV